MRSISIVGIDHYFGSEVFRVDQELWLEKDPDNISDEEAIKVVLETGVTVGYVANSIYTVAKGTRSAGRIYDTFEKRVKVKVIFIIHNVVIANIVD